MEEPMNTVFMELISVFLGFFFLLCALVMWLTDYHIIFPIKAITANADRIRNTYRLSFMAKMTAVRKSLRITSKWLKRMSSPGGMSGKRSIKRGWSVKQHLRKRITVLS